MAGPGGVGGSPRPPFNQQRVGLVSSVDLHPSLKNFGGDFSGILPEGFLSTITQANTNTIIADATSPTNAAYDVQPSDFVLLVDCTLGPMTIYLPPLTGMCRILIIKLLNGSYPCTVVPSYGTTDSFFNGDSVTLNMTDSDITLFGSNYWYIKNGIATTLNGDVQGISDANFITAISDADLVLLTAESSGPNNYGVTYGENLIVLVNCTLNNFTIDLPAAASGKMVLWIRRTDGNASASLALSASSGDTIDSYIGGIQAEEFVVLVSDGVSKWWGLAKTGSGGGGSPFLDYGFVTLSSGLATINSGSITSGMGSTQGLILVPMDLNTVGQLRLDPSTVVAGTSCGINSTGGFDSGVVFWAIPNT